MSVRVQIEIEFMLHSPEIEDAEAHYHPTLHLGCNFFLSQLKSLCKRAVEPANRRLIKDGGSAIPFSSVFERSLMSTNCRFLFEPIGEKRRRGLKGRIDEKAYKAG